MSTNVNQNSSEQPVASLLRAKDAQTSTVATQAWSAPDLQATIIAESKQAFERQLKIAKKEVAQALLVMRNAELAKAREQGLAEGRQQGYEAGYEQGYAEAKQVAETEISKEKEVLRAQQQATLQQLSSLVEGVTYSMSGIEDKLMQDMIWLTGQMAQALVMDALHIQPERVQQLVSHVVQNLPQLVYPLRIEVNPEGLTYIDTQQLTQEGRVDLQANDSLQAGEVLVQSGHSEVSLLWQQQTERLISATLKSFLDQVAPTTPVSAASDTTV